MSNEEGIMGRSISRALGKDRMFLLLLAVIVLAVFWGSGMALGGGAIIQVNTLDDHSDGACDTDCSIRDALGAAVAGDTIDIPPGVITLQLGEIQLNKNVSLSGAGARQTTIEASALPFGPGGANDRVLSIAPATSVEIYGMTIRHGYAIGNHGGGIFNDGGSLMSPSLISASRPRN